MKIGGTELKNGIILAPMAGVADNALRLICREAGAEFTVTEMISAKAVRFRDKKTLTLGYVSDGELPCAVQIFGSEPETMAEAAKFLCGEFGYAAADINMGCPAPKISGGGDGAALMRTPMLAGKIMEAVVAAVNLPVTVKIRAGWSDDERNAVEIAKIAEQSGIAAVTLHGRTRTQMYAPPADLEIIAETVAAVNIPVIGNGDIFSGADALKMKQSTGCAGVAVGRGALGNPWIFAEIAAAFDKRPYTPPTPVEKMALLRKHLELLIFYKGERSMSAEARKHVSWYIKNCPGAAAARAKINKSATREEMLEIAGSVILQ